MSKIKLEKYKEYREDEIVSLYDSVGWINYTNNIEMLSNAYKNSLDIIGAYDEDKLVGIIRIVGDGHSIIYIQDLLIRPEYQRQGIGSMMIKKILNIYDHVYQKVLMTDNEENTVEFYKNMELVPDFEVGAVAFMHIPN